MGDPIEGWVQQRRNDERHEGLYMALLCGFLLVPVSAALYVYFFRYAGIFSLSGPDPFIVGAISFAALFGVSIGFYWHFYRRGQPEGADAVHFDHDDPRKHALGSAVLFLGVLFWMSYDGVKAMLRTNHDAAEITAVIRRLINEPRAIEVCELLVECDYENLTRILPWLLRQREFFALRDPARIGLTESGREAFGQFINTPAGK